MQTAQFFGLNQQSSIQVVLWICMGITMIRKKGFVAALLTISMLMAILIHPTSVWAASATVSISTDSTTVSKGSAFTVSIIIDADEAVGGFEGFVSYDSDILEFAGGGVSITGGEGILRISNLEIPDSSNKIKYAMKFKALKVGNCNLSITDKPMVYSFDSGDSMSVSSTGISIDVTAEQKASKDAGLAELRISPGAISPAFDSNITEYSTDVENDVNQIIVSAKTTNDNASVEVSGNTNLKVGGNKVVITVSAESGDTSNYFLHVNKKDTTGEEKPEDVVTDTEEDKSYLTGSFQYKPLGSVIPEEIPEGYTETKIVINSQNITAYVPVDSVENEFLLIYAMNDNGEKGFYRYDRIEGTMQRYVEETPNSLIEEAVQSSEKDGYDKKLNQLSLIIAGLSAFSVLVIIIAIRLFMKNRGYKDEDLD